MNSALRRQNIYNPKGSRTSLFRYNSFLFNKESKLNTKPILCAKQFCKCILNKEVYFKYAFLSSFNMYKY